MNSRTSAFKHVNHRVLEQRGVHRTVDVFHTVNKTLQHVTADGHAHSAAKASEYADNRPHNTDELVDSMDSRVYPLEHTTGGVNFVSPRREVRRQPTQILGHVHKQRCTSASQLQEAVNYPTECITERLHRRSGVI